MWRSAASRRISTLSVAKACPSSPCSISSNMSPPRNFRRVSRRKSTAMQ
jgi:hypothetical protein